MTGAGKVVAVPPGKGASYRIGEDRFVVKGDSDPPYDSFSVIEYEGAAGFAGPPPHLHRSFDEAWFILEGEVSFMAERKVILAKSGTYLFVPRGVAHAFRVEGKEPARWLGIFSPARYVKLLEELGPLIPSHGPPDAAEIRQLFARYDTELV